MSEQKDKTPDQVSDEDYKVAPTSADEARLKKYHATADSKEQQANDEKYQIPTDTKVKEEMREGVE
jgi:hypothetical protein